MQMTMAAGTKGRFLRLTGPKAGGFLSLTGLWPEGCGGGFAANYKKGARLRRGLRRRVMTGKVDGPLGRRLWPPIGGGLCSLRSGGDSPHGLRGMVAPYRAMSFIMLPAAVTSTSSIIIILSTVHPFATLWPSSPKGDARSVTGLAVCVICDTISSATYFLVSP